MAYVLDNLQKSLYLDTKYTNSNDPESDRLNFQNKINAYSMENEFGNLNITENQLVLDAGCGNGSLTQFISQKYKAKVTGIDFSELRIQESKSSYPNSEFYVSDLNKNIKLKENQFDWVVSRYVYEYLPRPLFTTKELIKTLKPGGRICLVDLDGVFFNFHTPDESFNLKLQKIKSLFREDFEVGRKLPSFLNQAGFKNIQIKMTSHIFQDLELEQEAENANRRLQNASKIFIKILGKNDFINFRDSYLKYLKEPSSVLFFNKFITIGEK